MKNRYGMHTTTPLTYDSLSNIISNNSHIKKTSIDEKETNILNLVVSITSDDG